MKFEFPKASVYSYKDGNFVSKNYETDILLPEEYIGGNFYFKNECFIFPAFCDVHVHLREPGFLYKETIESGSKAAARGGYSCVMAMPNLSPVPDSIENINKELQIIKKSAVIDVLPYTSVTKGEKGEELVDFEALAPFAAAFSDDGKGVQREEMMKEAFLLAKKTGKIISAHCEDESLLHGGYIHLGNYSRSHGHRGICSESEWKPIERDIKLLRETGGKYHVCHISTKESVELIRRAKREGLDISCETAPHYLLLDERDIREDGCFKMNPPLRSPDDREALLEGIKDGTIDMIATDHAPHSAEEKSRGLEKSLMGIVGIETSFPLLYTGLVLKNVISLSKLIELMSINPRRRFSIPDTEDVCVFDLNKKYIINSEDFLSKGKSTPFEGKKVFGENLLTIHGGKAVWLKKDLRS